MLAGPQHLEGVAESAIREMSRLADAYGAINMAQDFPDLDPPPELVYAALDALQGPYNQHGLTWGSPRLREAIARKMDRFYGLCVHPLSEVTITVGVTEGMVAALLALVNPGERVILMEPAPESYWPSVVLAGAEPLWVPLEPPDFRFDPDVLAAAFDLGPRAIIINTPHNPTGRVFTYHELSLIAELCQRHDVIAISDEAFEHIVYDGRVHVPLATLPGMAERTVTVSGLGKSYHVTGWRVGWVVAPPPLTEAIRKVHDLLVVSAPTPLEEAAVVALELPDGYYADLLGVYARKRARAMEMLAEAGFVAAPPEGTWYVLADFTPLNFPGDDYAFAHYLATEIGVAVVPGSSFCHDPLPYAHTVRFTFARRDEVLEEAAYRLKALRR